jgi:hypothetical protein
MFAWRRRLAHGWAVFEQVKIVAEPTAHAANDAAHHTIELCLPVSAE